MIYFAKIKKTQDSYLVDFPDLKGCMTEGDTLEEAQKYAKEVLNGWMATRYDMELKIPKAKEYQGRAYYPIEVDLQIVFAIRLRQARLKQGLSQSQVAKRLGITQQAYAKFESPDSTNPSLKTIKKLAEALELGSSYQLVA